MPTTSTIPNALKELLKRFKTNLTRLSRHTGIPRARLIALFQASEFTQAELRCFVDALSPAFAGAFFRSAQTGHFNQAGYANRQKVINNFNVVIHVTLVGEPKPNAVGRSLEQWDVHQGLPGGHAHQIGQPSAVRGLNRAA